MDTTTPTYPCSLCIICVKFNKKSPCMERGPSSCDDDLKYFAKDLGCKKAVTLGLMCDITQSIGKEGMIQMTKMVNVVSPVNGGDETKWFKDLFRIYQDMKNTHFLF